MNPLMRRLNQAWERRFAARSSGAEPEGPCVPCGAKDGVRAFSLNPPPVAVVGDGDLPMLVPDVLFTILDDAVVLYQPAMSRSHVLNASAALVWAEVDDERTVAEIVDALQLANGAERGVLDRDVKETLSWFQASGIVRFSASTGGLGEADWAEVRGAALDQELPAPWAAAVRRILDERPWPLVIGPVRASGLDLVVRTDAIDTVAELRTALGALPPTTTSECSSERPAAEPTVVSLVDGGPGRARRLRFYVDGTRRWDTDYPGEFSHRAMAAINQLAIERTTGQLRLHAGAVERNGRVVVIAGDSGRGKSTLTAALVQRGFAYLTDELVAIDPTTLAVLPYPKAIDLDTPSHDLLGLELETGGDTTRPHKRGVAPSRLGSVSPGGHLALVVLLNDEMETGAGLGTPQPRHANVVVELLGLVFGPSFEDETTLDTLARLATTVPMLRLCRLSLPEACARIEAELG